MGAPDLNGEVNKAVKALLGLQTRTLPIKAGNEAINMFKDNFRKGGFFGRPWEEPVRRRLSFHGTDGKNGTLLSGRNHLMNSFDKDTSKPGRVIIKNPVEYATMHNDGGSITVTAKMKKYFMYRFIQTKGGMKLTKRGKPGKNKRNQALSREARFYLGMATKKAGSSIRIPKRQFVGNHPELAKRINGIICNELKNFIERYGRNTRTAR